MRKKTVSIITICRNEKKIERTCVSVINQTFQDFEWIVIDGASTDGTLDILKKYHDRIDLLISEKDNGIYAAMNKGIKHAKGEWIIFMNGGDCFYNYSVLNDVFYHKKYKNIDILYGTQINEITGRELISIKPSLLSFDFFQEQSISHQASFIKRNLFKKYGLYNENFKIVSDWEKWITFLQKKCVFYNIGIIVSKMDILGISCTNLLALKKERQSVFDQYAAHPISNDYLKKLTCTITLQRENSILRFIRELFKI